MGFSVGKYARIWSCEDKGNYSLCRLSVSRRNKDTGTYVQEFSDGFVRLVGNAHTAMKNITIPENGYSIKISSCDVTNVYIDQNGKANYTPHYTIFGFEDANVNNNNKNNNGNNNSVKSGADDFMTVPDGIEDELPFN